MAKTKGKTKTDEFNILITGVGGQGVMTLGAIIAQAAINEGKEVRTSELHGLAKRFGHTEFHLRIGKDAKTTIIPNRSADVIIALEPLESLPLIKYCDKGKTLAFLDSVQIKPTKMDIEEIPYPGLGEIKEKLKPHVKEINGYAASGEAVKQTGKSVYANIYLLGKMLKRKALPVSVRAVSKTIEDAFGKEGFNLKILNSSMKGKD